MVLMTEIQSKDTSRDHHVVDALWWPVGGLVPTGNVLVYCRFSTSYWNMFNHVIFSISLKVKEMARKLDSLLEGIEGEGGLRDASICAHRSSVLELEEGIESVSEKCRIWRILQYIQSGTLDMDRFQSQSSTTSNNHTSKLL
ncbi:hypothetical protein H5410_064350 [Solanum commersonii]|uniref:Uncharacterized protein n=1 Tax=Solanum commersonii TaxID=4109 RepID=A0A9J5VZR5_SOLCO|nr:hypothetical protein H5410_064350 [Solanum commersonii]